MYLLIPNLVDLSHACFFGGSAGKESACNVGDLCWIPGWERSPGGGHVNPLQYSLPGEPPRTEEPGGLYSPWGRKESDMTEQLSTSHAYCFFLLLKQKTHFPLVIQ